MKSPIIEKRSSMPRRTVPLSKRQWKKERKDYLAIKEALWEEQSRACYYCKVPMLKGRWNGKTHPPHNFWTLEHLKSREAPTLRRDFSKGNLALSCYKCNHERGCARKEKKAGL